MTMESLIQLLMEGFLEAIMFPSTSSSFDAPTMNGR
jgi:hypothetical protein